MSFSLHTINKTIPTLFLTSLSVLQNKSLAIMGRSKLPPRRFINKQKSIKPVRSFQQPRLTLHDQPPIEIFTSSEGIRGEVLRLGISGQHDESLVNHLFLIPGNPGIVEYYRPLIRQIWRRLPNDLRTSTSIHAVGLPGHDLRELNGTTTFGLSHHVCFVREYIASVASHANNIMFIGHSYGSFLASRVASGLKQNRNYSIAMLMPCMWQMGKCAGNVIRMGLQNPYGISSWIAWGITAFLPASIRDVVLDWQNHPESVMDISRRLIDGRRRSVYANVCSLGKDEIRWILEPSEKELEKFRDRALLIWANDDQWCPLDARERIEEAFRGRLQTTYAGDGVKHSFVLNTTHTEILAKTLVPWICENLQRRKDNMIPNGVTKEERYTER